MMRAIKEYLSIWTLANVAAEVVIGFKWERVASSTLIEWREVTFKTCSSASTPTSTTASATPARPKDTLLEIKSFLSMTLAHGVTTEAFKLLGVLPLLMKFS